MKKICVFFVLFTSFIFFFLLESCQQQDPESVIHKFSTHWYKGELNEAGRYTTPESKETIRLLFQGRTEKELEDKRNNIVENKFIDHLLINDTTMLYQCETRVNGDLMTTSYFLRKINKKWYIDITN